MRATSFGPLAAALLAGWSSASPIMPVDVQVGKPQPDPMYRRALELAHQPMLEKRLSEQFSLARSWTNEVLFAGSWLQKEGIGATDSVALTVKCVECYTKGTVTASLTDKEIINPTVRLDFSGVEAYIDVEVAMSVGSVYSLNLFTSSSPIGLGFPGVSVGVVFYVDLVFSISEQLDLEGGFWVKLADGSFLEASVFGGDITNHFFDGLSSKSLPVTVYSGKATFKADLRLRVQCGAETDFMGIGGSAELGIYANLIEFVAVLEQTADCDLQSLEWWDLNVGAFAHLDVVVDYKTIGAIPTVSTTLLTAPTLTQCWIPHGGSSPSRTSTATTVRGSSTSYAGRTTASTSAGKSSSAGASSSTYGSGSTITSAPYPSGSTAGSSSASYPTLSSTSGKYQVSNSSASSGYDQDITSTVTSTTVYTITSCAASVVNCPASYQSEIVVTETVDVYTTVCPASATVTPPTSASSAYPAESSAAAPVVIVDIVTDIIVLVPCESPVVETFVPPPATSSSSPAAGVPSQPPVKEVVPSSSASYAQGEAKSTSTAYAAPSSSGNGTYAYSTGVKPTTSYTPTGSAAPSKSAVTAGASAARSISGAVVVLALVAGTMALM